MQEACCEFSQFNFKKMLKPTPSDDCLTRRTNAQETVLAALQNHRQPMSAQGLYREIKAKHSVGLTTVYRSLNALQKSGHIQHRINLEGTTLYSLTNHDRHCMTCLLCGQSFPINVCPVAELGEQLQDSSKFKIFYHTLEFFGRCGACAPAPV